MMKLLRKYLLLLIGGFIAVLLLAVAGTALVRYRIGYQRVHGELKSKLQRLETLNRRQPFPSDENVRVVAENRESMEALFQDTLKAMAAGQAEPLQVESAEFPQRVARMVRSLQARAAEAEVTIPEQYAFSFERYLAGESPEDKDIPHLTIQLQQVQRLVELLFTAKVTALHSLTRETFETGRSGAPEAHVDEMGMMGELMMEGPGRSRRRGPAAMEMGDSAPEQAGPYKDPSGLFFRERYTLSFNAAEGAAWDVLNRLARSPSFLVVRSVRMESERPGRQEGQPDRPGMAGGGGRPGMPEGMVDDLLMDPARAHRPGMATPRRPEGAPARLLPHHERITAGREQVNVTLELDLYRFIDGGGKESAS